MMENKKVVFITTGGTIEKIYDEASGALINKSSNLEESFLAELRYQHLEFDISHLMSKDSLKLTKVDRDKILNKVKEKLKLFCPIIILHGTDTLHETAVFLSEGLMEEGCELQQPIIFTGAMTPRHYNKSDAMQNVTEAIMSSQFLEPGIFLCFHGQVYKSLNFKKDKKKGIFFTQDFCRKKS